jgi:membrane protein implicated in regulation of membrane protease activity
VGRTESYKQVWLAVIATVVMACISIGTAFLMLHLLGRSSLPQRLGRMEREWLVLFMLGMFVLQAWLLSRWLDRRRKSARFPRPPE